MEYAEQKICYYELLKVDKKADQIEIKKSYKKMALVYHPDKAPKGEQEAYKNKFQTINEAFQVLSDVNQRAWYDSHRAEFLNPHIKDDGYIGFSFDIADFLKESAFKKES